MEMRGVTTVVRTREAAIAGNGGDRVVNYVFSTPEVARDGHTILGWDVSNFGNNPVFLWAHDAGQPPIGRVIDITAKGGLLTGSVLYAPADVSPFADMVYRLAVGGFLNAVSVSWLPLKWSYSKDKSRPGGIDFQLAELLEVSQVPVPSLPSALATARAAGIDTKPMIAWSERALDLNPETFQMTKPQLVELRRAAGATAVHKVPAAPATPMWRSFGEQLQAVARASDRNGVAGIVDNRLVRAPTGAGEQNPADGGFVVDSQWAEPLVQSIYDSAVLAPLTDRRETSRPLADVKLPAIDEASRADGSRYGGVLSYWAAEGASVSNSWPRWKRLEFSAKKLIGVAPVSNELLADVPMLGAHLTKAFGAELGFKLDLAILAGKTGTPLGILNSTALIAVAKESGQAAATIVWENIYKMWARLPAPSRKRATWVVNEDATGQLAQMSQVIGTGAVPVYLPANALSITPRLMGAPVLEVEQANPLGQLGDIVLADMSQYVLIDGGTNPALSLHCRFVNDEAVFRLTARVDGQPNLATPITPYNGTSARSPFVALAAR